MSNYPIGATWEAKDKSGKVVGEIYLERRESNTEIWKFWYVASRSVSGGSDWASSYQMARKMCLRNERFKRVK